jgi:hypothetical protein
MLVYSSDISTKKQKFLESIKSEGDNKSSSSEIAPILKPLMERFPNLSSETLEKLSTSEGIKNRHKIIQSLPENELKSKLCAKDIQKLDDTLTKEDLKEIQSLGDNKTIDQIKAISSVNNFHNDHLNNIKRRASQMSINNPTYPGQIETIFQEPSSSNNQSSSKSVSDTTHLDDTMNLFE